MRTVHEVLRISASTFEALLSNSNCADCFERYVFYTILKSKLHMEQRCVISCFITSTLEQPQSSIQKLLLNLK